MGKYLELFRGEVGGLTEKTKLENKPYVAYSTKLGKVTYTIVPTKDPVIEGPADNEIWYTTVDGSIMNPNLNNLNNNTLIDNTYKDGLGILTFTDTVKIAHFSGNGGIGGNASVFDGAEITGGKLKTMQFPLIDDTIVGHGMWADNEFLTTVNIPNGVVAMLDGLFVGCANLTSITIPVSVIKLGESYLYEHPETGGFYKDQATFEGSSITDIYYEGTVEQWSNIEIIGENPAITVHCTDGDVTI